MNLKNNVPYELTRRGSKKTTHFAKNHHPVAILPWKIIGSDRQFYAGHLGSN